MEEWITLCGDNCFECPRYHAHTEDELRSVAELWYKVGWRDQIVTNDEIRCSGCSSHKECTYHLVECIKEHNISKCNQCREFPCDKITKMLTKTKTDQEHCKQICSEEEYRKLERAFFKKGENLRRK